MDIRVIEDRIRAYNPISKHDELNAFKEISQEIALLALSRAEFFKHAAFQGDTCLQIVYGLPRFSEDLDFILLKPNPQFIWQQYLNEIKLEFDSWGFSLQIKDRSEVNNSVKKAFLKENSFGKVLQLMYTREQSDAQTIQIKVEIDTNPPLGSDFDSKLIEFPTPYSIQAQSLPSLFAGKLHALLCRKYVKGRDWYDFIWYITKNTPINYTFLKQALLQQGPWTHEQNMIVDRQWICEELTKKVNSIDWEQARRDVEVFLKPRELESLKLWSPYFFAHFIEKIHLS